MVRIRKTLKWRVRYEGFWNDSVHSVRSHGPQPISSAQTQPVTEVARARDDLAATPSL